MAELAIALLGGRPISHPGVDVTGRDVLGLVPAIAVWATITLGLILVGRRISTIDVSRFTPSSLRGDLLGAVAAMVLVSPLLTVVPGWWSLAVALPLLALNQIWRDQARSRQRFQREPVTGLLDRSGLQVGLASLTESDVIRAHPRPLAIVFINIEAVLEVSRSLGRSMYEQVVAVAARRLRHVFGDDRVGRLAGEGFVILLPDASRQRAREIAANAVRLLDDPVELDGIPFDLHPVAGIAMSPEHGRDLATLVENAELAMVDARNTGRPTEMYRATASDVTQHRLDILTAMGDALRRPAGHSEVVMVYQPQVDLATRRPVGVEALVRWTHPEWGPVPADELIAAIESSHIMHMLTSHVVHHVAGQLAAWNDIGVVTRASVNVSVNDLRDDGLLRALQTAVAATGIHPRQLMVEITEGALATDLSRITQAARAITDAGFALSLDDFGTGYASVQQLRRLPLSEIKIDRSFVSDFLSNRASQAIVHSVHGIGRTMGIVVVAEGIEDDATTQALSQLPGIIGQGWYLGEPMLPADFVEWWRKHVRD
ncbi:diguanylate cyclase (GGDEF)-like protein [Hamadaea flava]|uniref:Bifunctional diguanylate cyclase/phosphodiesterase n=1 Tax=Hamadaea flava TaxID=1742688 RepID=A0ABV8LLI3_9ACTN|nr:GGDEF domain-containing phosphodiesterase [Hamadaea flava]MCP2329592.1 diguanylate cyclase (GGDEF)-like protein [Hamadaea flava]